MHPQRNTRFAEARRDLIERWAIGDVGVAEATREVDAILKRIAEKKGESNDDERTQGGGEKLPGRE